MRTTAVILYAICSLLPLSAQTEGPKGATSFEQIKSTFLAATDALIGHFWAASFQGCDSCYYFNSRSDEADKKNEWWWQAHAMDVIVDAYRLTGNERYRKMYELWFDGIQRYNYEQWPDDPWRNQSVDDTEWIALTLIHMFETTGERKYLLQAQRLYDKYIITTWGPNDEAPWYGGISWSTDPKIHKSKNACSNGPAGIIAALLARHAKALDERHAKKLAKAYQQDLKRIYHWERDHLYNGITGAVYDSMGRRGIGRHVWSYNTATFIDMASELYSATHQQQYVDDAIKAADYTINRISDPKTGLMNNVSWLEKGGDMGLFHGIFFRYLAQFIQCKALPDGKKKAYINFLDDNCQCAIRCLQPEVNIFSKNWVTDTVTSTADAPLTPHVTGCTLLSATLASLSPKL